MLLIVQCTVSLLFSECDGFESESKRRKIENVNQLKSHGTVIQIECVDGYDKLSGPDAVTCLDDNTFPGLDDVFCSSEYMFVYVNFLEGKTWIQ